MQRRKQQKQRKSLKQKFKLLKNKNKVSKYNTFSLNNNNELFFITTNK